jgi:endonuclease/exonuclease/phosphatase family metal-dependent hydrolase
MDRQHTSNTRTRSLRAASVAVGVVLLVFAGGPVMADEEEPDAVAPRNFTVMTQNLYLGTDLQPLFGKSGADLIAAAGTAYTNVVASDFPDRAESIVREIAQDSPDVVALQEVALWQTGPDPQHLQPSYDFLAILLGALADHGASYRAVAVNVNVSQALPITFDLHTWASFTDRDAIIVRADLPTSQLDVSNPRSHNFQAKLVVPIGGTNLQVPRGWSSVDVKVRGKSYRLANTHLEAYDPGVRRAQALELSNELSASPIPVVLAGDLNSLPGDATGPYGIFTGSGYVDSWVQAMDGQAGYTAGQDINCTIPSGIDHRVDYVMHNDDPYVEALPGSGDIVGEEDADCTPPTGTYPDGLRPSDHAGVVLGMHIAAP